MATKIGRYGDDEFDFSAERTYRSVDESLRRVGVEYLDVIQVHDFEYDDPRHVTDETIPALRRLVEQDKARFVGITGYPLKIFRVVLNLTRLTWIRSFLRITICSMTRLSNPYCLF
jgi:L-galactose dehydrogenase